jgi:hypothetical protein
MTPHLTPHSRQQNGKQCIPQKQEEYKIRGCEINDISYLSNNLRKSDINELYAASGNDAFTSVFAGAMSADYLKVATKNNKPFMIFGTSPNGSVWMVGTHVLEQFTIPFLRLNKQYVKELHIKHKLLWNYTDVRNHVHHKWLKWLGFVFIRRCPYGPFKKDFYEFAKLGK